MNKGSGFHTVRGYQLKNQQKGRLTPALEDYLEMVYRLCQEVPYTRIGKLAERLHVRPPSASKMIAKLVEMGYLEYDRYDSILLTDIGKSTGAFLLERHVTMERFLLMIGNDNPLEEAELMEHSISPATAAHMRTLVDFFKDNPRVEAQYQDYRRARRL